LVWSSGP